MSTATETFVVQNVILSYPHLFVAREVNNNGNPKFSAKMYFDANAAGVISQKMQELAGQGFQQGEPTLPKFKWPIAYVSEQDKTNPRLADRLVGNANAHAGYPPQVVGPDRQPLLDRSQIYGGVVAAVAMRLYTYNNMGNVGIGMGFSAVMKTADGEPLADDVLDPNKLFEGVQAQVATQPAPTGIPGIPGIPQQQTEQPAPTGIPGIPGLPFQS